MTANQHHYDERNQCTTGTEICSPEKFLANIETAEDETSGPLWFIIGPRCCSTEASQPDISPKK